ncbi:hypothetical protein B0H17DRAFT_1277309 [Mycena rosella]|uniref:F-box domain-containing protein n=1 Tax=Mycena rosella TaxID=1033263 RepID=A0AAD7DKG5_MYCRO|nr:hypothetical protein B0H17DRAFT_1277309 [Mycena rosella]
MSGTSLRAQAADLILSISRQKQILHDTEAQFKTVQQQLDSLVYPVLTLPHEITSEIFVHCLPAKPSWLPNTTEAPLLLMHVCSAWRNIAGSTPALWSTFNIALTAGIEPYPYFSEVAKAWLQRASHRPLSVKIFGRVSQADNFGPFTETFRRHAAGMQSLELYMEAVDFHRLYTGPLRFPMLQSLSIRLLENGEDVDAYEALEMFGDAPILHELLMGDVPRSFIILPWDQLTKFTGDLYNLVGCLGALRAMPNLVECHFSVYDTDHLDNNHVQPSSDGIPDSFSHPKLESLTLFESMSVAFLTPARSIKILNFLTLPGLQILHIMGAQDFDEGELNSFLARSAPPLRELLIRPHVHSEGHTEIQLTSFLPNLTDLEIWYPENNLLTASSTCSAGTMAFFRGSRA